MKRFLSLLMAIALCFLLASCSANKPAATPENTSTVPPAATEAPTSPVVTVNGEDLLYDEYMAIESAYLYQYEAAGVDLTDAEVYAYLQDLAMTYAVEQMLVRQDMTAQGCYNFDEADETWFAEQGKAAYNAALQSVMDAMRTAESTDDELLVYALAYAEALGVTEQTYVDFYRTQYASERYHQWLIQDHPVTDEEVAEAYEARVAASQASFENDVAAFETAISTGAEVWYVPAGYRNILQILLPATGDTSDAKLASVQPAMDDIYTRLDKGETFESLIREYGKDTAFEDESFFSTGYQVHQDSVVWEDSFITAAFSAEMAEPGCWSQPFTSNMGVHILYYLSDAASGPIALTDDLHTALASTLYAERYSAAQAERINTLADAAEIVFH